MRLDLHAKVLTADGEEAGTVEQAIVDPETNEVKSVVLKTDEFFGRNVLLPRAELEGAREEDDTLRLRLTRAEVERLPDFEPDSYVEPPADWVAPLGFIYPSYLWPAAADPEVGIVTAPPPPDAPVDEVMINKGDLVVDRDGDDVGIVDEIRFDPRDGRIQGFVLRVGGLLERILGSGKLVEIDQREIKRVGGGVVYLRVDKDEIARRA